jgi:UDP-glucose 4-epimerase
MRILVTGSAGHLGEALMRTLAAAGHAPLGADIRPSPQTQAVGSITDRGFVRDCVAGVSAILHAATLHKPHVATHARQQFVDSNVTGTLNLLEEAAAQGVGRFVFTSTTSAFGAALEPPPGAPAAWIDETVQPAPRNIYGVTKAAAEDLCALFRREGLACIILRTARFFPEADDRATVRDAYSDENAKANEFLYRRVDLEDVVTAHLAALARAAEIGFGRYIVSATTPFRHEDLAELRAEPARVVARRVAGFAAVYARRGWRMFPSIDRVYANDKARRELGWAPAWDFARVLEQATRREPIGSALARDIGIKGYHADRFEHGPYPVE